MDAFLIVGLGNPGPRYARTRHNVGFMVLDRLDQDLGLDWRTRGNALVARWGAGWLMKPLTYMNLSGEAVAPFVRYYRIPLARVLVVHDDLDLPLGRLRFRARGSSGGQRGVASIIAHLGSEAFPRLKVGIGRPPAGWAAPDWVLSPFKPEEADLLARVVDRAAEGVRVWLEEGLARAQQRYNGLDLAREAGPDV